MAACLVPKQGIPALAYSALSASQRPSHLIVKYAEAFKQATVFLQFPLLSDTKASITLVYDADNLLCDETSLTHVNTALPSDRLKPLARDGSPELMKLCLSLKQLCPISCPMGLPPTRGNEPLIQQLSDIASAREVNILFDFKWVHQEHRGTFWQIVRRPQDLSGIPADLRTLYQPREWLAAFQSAKKVASEASSLWAPSKKRSRQASPTPNPPRKRTSSDRARVSSAGATRSPAESCVVDVPPEDPPLYDDVDSWQSKTRSAWASLPPSKAILHSAALDPLGSPTEKATSEPTSSPSPSALDIDEIISKKVQQLLPQVLRDALPSELVKLLSARTTSPSAPHHDFAGLVRAQAASFLRKFQDDTHDQVERLRNTAVEEFNEVLKDKQLDVDIAQDDHMTELDRVFAEKVAEFKDRAEEIADEVHDRAYHHFGARLQWLMQEETARAFERRPDFGRRSASLPL